MMALRHTGNSSSLGTYPKFHHWVIALPQPGHAIVWGVSLNSFEAQVLQEKSDYTHTPQGLARFPL